MQKQIPKPHKKNRNKRSLRLLAVMVAGTAAGIHANGTAADADLPCTHYREPGAGWPPADAVPVPCGELPDVLLLEPIPSRAEIESHHLWQVKAPSTYRVVQALNDGGASIKKRYLSRYQDIYGHHLLIGSKVEPQGFTIDRINRPTGPISGQFFNSSTTPMAS